MSKPRLLIASYVNHTPAVLKPFLQSLEKLYYPDYDVLFYFQDENSDPASSDLLKKAIVYHGKTVSRFTPDVPVGDFMEERALHASAMKNTILMRAMRNNFDYLLYLDPEITLPPAVVPQLIARGKEIICALCWTTGRDGVSRPNVWQFDRKQDDAFYRRLNTPGIYEVGGVSKCTLFSVAALKKGVHFSPLKNVATLDADRCLSVRAAACGIPLFVDTSFPVQAANG